MPRIPNRPQIARWAQLIDWLQRETNFTSRRAAGELGVTDRTIRADLDGLRESGVPVEWDARRNTYYLTDPAAPLPVLFFSRDDFAAFLVAQHALEALGDGLAAATLAGITDRLAAHLPERVYVEPQSLVQHLRVLQSGPRTAARPAFHTTLLEAVEARQIVALRYYTASRDATTERHVEPYALAQQAGRWYVAAYCYHADGWRDFRLDRIETLEVTGAIFAGRTFDADAYFDAAFGMHRGDAAHEVHLRFSAYQSRWMREETWHPSQHVTENADGTLDLMMEVEGLPALVRWVLSYGPEVEVIGPPALRAAVADAAYRTARHYELP